MNQETICTNIFKPNDNYIILHSGYYSGIQRKKHKSITLVGVNIHVYAYQEALSLTLK